MPKMLLKPGYQLTDSPFYNLRSRKKLTELLRIPSKILADLPSSHLLYTRRWKHKKQDEWLKNEPLGSVSNDYRPIDIPDSRLKKIQSRIAELLSRIAAPEFLFSPVKGRSYVDNAARHVGNSAFWLLDVENYFPSCSANKVARFFRRDMNCSPDVTAILVRLVTHNQCLPQGSPCSPILAYYCNREMWLNINQIIIDEGLKFSLYADDITISGHIIKKKLIWEIKMILFKNGYRLNPSKISSLIHTPADITGVIVKSGRIHLPNRQHKKLWELRQQRIRTQSTKDKNSIDKKIAGRLAQKKQVERLNLSSIQR